MPHGHDGMSEPFERQPSLHFLHMHESPKMAKLRANSPESTGRPRTQSGVPGPRSRTSTGISTGTSPQRPQSVPSISPGSKAPGTPQSGGATLKLPGTPDSGTNRANMKRRTFALGPLEHNVSHEMTK